MLRYAEYYVPCVAVGIGMYVLAGPAFVSNMLFASPFIGAALVVSAMQKRWWIAAGVCALLLPASAVALYQGVAALAHVSAKSGETWVVVDGMLTLFGAMQIFLYHAAITLTVLSLSNIIRLFGLGGRRG